MNFFKNRNLSPKMIIASIVTFLVALILGISNISFKTSLAIGSATDKNAYMLVLDNTNAVSNAGNVVQHTKNGGNVTFTYTGVTGASGKHVRINENGTVVNKDQITSIDRYVAVFSGPGKLYGRIGYVTSKLSDSFELVSGQAVDVSGTEPYYLEIKASGGYVDLTSAIFTYDCQTNPAAQEQDTSGSYDITFGNKSSLETDGTAEIGGDTILSNNVTAGASYISSINGTSKVYVAANSNGGLKFGSSKGPGSMTINFNSTLSNKIKSITFSANPYGTDGCNVEIEVNGGGTGKEASFTPNSTVTSGCLTFSEETNVSTITISTSFKRAYILGISLEYGGKTEPGTPDIPLYEVGFTAEDANKDDYTTNSIFDNDNGLSVATTLSDGSHNSLSSSEYSYVVTDSLDNEIDTSEKFPAEGIYTLTVSYGNYIPIEITLNVGEYVYIDEVTPSLETNTYNTADTMGQHLTGNLSALVVYSNNDHETVQYSAFESKGLGVKLLNPKGFTYDMNIPFGIDGTWKIMVYRLDDDNIKGTVNITVNAIPVTNITMNHESKTLYPNDELQLTVTVNPTNATNTGVYWESNNESVATVDENGLVTAVAVGGAIIKATAADGSNVYGQCEITVVAKPNYEKYDIDLTSTSQRTSNTASSVIFTCTPASFKIEKHNSSTNANNYVATNSQTRVYNNQKVTFSAGGQAIHHIVIHGHSYGISGLTTQNRWTNATISVSGSEITVTPTDAESNIYVIPSATSGISGISYYIGEAQAATPVYPTAISLTAPDNSISIGSTTQLTVGYTPNETNVKNVTFESSASSVATVSASGLITGVSAGNATITATAEAANNQTKTATFNITVTTIAVTSVSLSDNSISVKAGKTYTLVPTILPSNATNKNVTWSTTDNKIASVSNGVVTGVAAGSATITVTTVDGSKTATCVVTVTASSASSGWELVTNASTLAAGDVLVIADNTNGVTAGDISSQVMGEISTTFTSEKDEIEELGEGTITLTLGGSEGNWTLTNEEGQLLGATSVKKLAWGSGTTTWEISIGSSGAATIQNTNSSFGRFLHNTSSPRFTTYTSATSSTMLLPQLYRGGAAEPTDPTDIILSPTSCELAPKGTKTIGVSYVPSNANQNKDITWATSNSNVATVDATGKITVKEGATAGQTATITATLTNIPSIHKSCTVSVVETQLDDHTVMIYMCGADLESGTDTNGNVPSASNAAGYASGDLDEILKVTGQPDDVNIIVETGGANIWQSGHSYSISSTKLERWHVENKSLVRDETLKDYVSMGLTSTFQSFLEWGLENYPAERTGVILWNHGGGMHGVCYDEKKNDDNLLNDEVHTAVGNALKNTGNSGKKLEWIGYDACLMAVQDIAEFNSDYFNYQISSEESEAGEGWDYDKWVDNLYAKQTTTSILKEICDTFIADNGGVSGRYGQTLSYLDLSYMSTYKTAWENMTTALSNKLTSGNKSTFNNAIVNNVQRYADEDYDYFCLFDAKDFINELVSGSAFSSFRIDSSYTTAVLNAFANVVAYSKVQDSAGESYGLCMYWPNSTAYSYISTYYTTSQTRFTKWQAFCNTYGTHR